MTMYKIRIQKTELEEVTLAKEWKKGAGTKTGDSDDDDYGYGYTPETTTHRLVERTIYEQVVDDLDLAKVIFAVNSQADDYQRFVLNAEDIANSIK